MSLWAAKTVSARPPRRGTFDSPYSLPLTRRRGDCAAVFRILRLSEEGLAEERFVRGSRAKYDLSTNDLEWNPHKGAVPRPCGAHAPPWGADRARSLGSPFARPTAFSKWIATAATNGNVILWNVERAGRSTAKGEAAAGGDACARSDCRLRARVLLFGAYSHGAPRVLAPHRPNAAPERVAGRHRPPLGAHSDVDAAPHRR